MGRLALAFAALVAAATAGLGGHAPGPPAAKAVSFVFDDEFSGPAGAAPDPAKWWRTPWCSSASDDKLVCYNPANAYQDGAGHLVLKVSPGTMGRPWDAARIQGFR